MEIGPAYRRFLPHYQNRERSYFVTFCTRDRKILSPEARSFVLAEIVRHHKELYCLYMAVVMPDHVHLLLDPVDTPMGEIVRRIKGASARSINAAINSAGSVWQREYFDRQIRKNEDVRAKGEYIAQNPVRAGIVALPAHYRWL